MSHHDHPNITDPRSTDEIIAAMHARAAAVDAVRDANALCAKHLQELVALFQGVELDMLHKALARGHRNPMCGVGMHRTDAEDAARAQSIAINRALLLRAEAEARLLATFEKG